MQKTLLKKMGKKMKKLPKFLSKLRESEKVETMGRTARRRQGVFFGRLGVPERSGAGAAGSGRCAVGVCFCGGCVFRPRRVFFGVGAARLGWRRGASRPRRDGNGAPVQSKFHKPSRKPSKGSTCGAVSAGERRLPSGGKAEVFIVVGEIDGARKRKCVREGAPCAQNIQEMRRQQRKKLKQT